MFADVTQLRDCSGLIRLEPPNECWQTTLAILQAGIAACQNTGRPHLGRAELTKLNPVKGELLAPWQWYHGFSHWLQLFAAETTHLHWMNHPHEIIVAFDKLQTLQRWEAVLLPTPPRYPAIQSYDQLRSLIGKHHARLFFEVALWLYSVGSHRPRMAWPKSPCIDYDGNSRDWWNKATLLE